MRAPHADHDRIDGHSPLLGRLRRGLINGARHARVFRPGKQPFSFGRHLAGSGEKAGALLQAATELAGTPGYERLRTTLLERGAL